MAEEPEPEVKETVHTEQDVEKTAPPEPEPDDSKTIKSGAF